MPHSYPRLLGIYNREKNSKGVPFVAKLFELTKGGLCTVTADADIDVDGIGKPYGDRYFQPNTSLHFRGKPLDSDIDKFMVVPGDIVKAVEGIVLGCRGRVKNLRNGLSCECVVGDTGPTTKVGEISRAVAKVLKINPDPNIGGEDDPVVLYEFEPGVAALIDGRQYSLQPS